MSDFSRSGSGLSNQHLFLDVDAVVYLEGGPALTQDQIDNDYFHDHSSDIKYWQTVFEYYLPSKSFQFKSKGSKSAVKPIALKIQSGTVTNVIAVMDRDFDHLIGKKVSSPNVLYSYGYSWENDCWSPHAISRAAIFHTGLDKSHYEIVNGITTECFSNFLTQVEVAVKADCKMMQCSSTFFDRGAEGRYISYRQLEMPCLIEAELNDAFEKMEKDTGITKADLDDISINCESDCYGHLYACFCYYVFVYLSSKIKDKKVSIDFDSVLSLVIQKFVETIDSGALPEIHGYYNDAFNQIVMS